MDKAFEGFNLRKNIQKRVDENLKRDEVTVAVNQLKKKKVRRLTTRFNRLSQLPITL